jgi:uncharacterized RDD family membrane protein YckC
MSPRKSRPLRYRGVNIGGGESNPQRAPWLRRVGAYLIDSFLVLGVSTLGYLAVEGRSYFAVDPATDHRWWVRLLVLTLCGAVYYGSLMALTNGQTVGKRLLKLCVIRDDGKKMTVTRAVWREVVVLIVVFNLLSHAGGALSALVFLLALLDGAWPLWDRENRALHDFAAGTVVRSVGKQDAADTPAVATR